MAVEIPFYHRVPLSHPDYALTRCLVFRKEIIFQVVLDLRDPCIGTFLRNWARLPGTASFEVLIRPSSPSLAGWAEGFSRRLWKTPSGTGA
jgi:hypothetical protein